MSKDEQVVRIAKVIADVIGEEVQLYIAAEIVMLASLEAGIPIYQLRNAVYNE